MGFVQFAPFAEFAVGVEALRGRGEGEGEEGPPVVFAEVGGIVVCAAVGELFWGVVGLG